MTTAPGIELRRSAQRFRTRLAWLDSRHSFSFGGHYDPDNTRHGLLLVLNDDIVQPKKGFATHPHQDMEIVTWVLDGELEHRDSEGHHAVIYPGLAQRMSAGTGIWHSEMNPDADREVRFVQMWVEPDATGIRPGYEQLDITKELGSGGLVAIASGRRHAAAVSIHQKNAVLWGGRLAPGKAVRLPDAPHVHLYVAKGGADLEGAGPLAAGDAARLSAAGGRRLTADAHTGAEVLVWETA